MEPRSYEANADAMPPVAPATPSVGYPRSGNPATLTGATKPGPFWHYQIGEELRNIITMLGALTPSTADLTQAATAIKNYVDSQVGDFSLDTGTANAKVVALNPAITAYTGDFTGRFKNLTLNTGACTVNFGGGAVPLVNDQGGALVAGDLPAAVMVNYQYVHADGKAYITGLVTSQALTQAAAAALFAALAGSVSQQFNVANASGGTHAVALGQVRGHASLANNAAQTFAVGTTKATLNSGLAAGGGCSADSTNSRIVVNDAGDYSIGAFVTGTGTIGSTQATLQLYVNGAPVPWFLAIASNTTIGEQLSASFCTVYPLPAGAVLELYVSASTNSFSTNGAGNIGLSIVRAVSA